ncbi:MAG: hypothetical protein IPJ62_18095 [Betaproteobacteria bacterium]|nr:hypothetical protein [Betaproteobacteria bacterium]
MPLLADQQMALMTCVDPLPAGCSPASSVADADGPPSSRRAVIDFPLGNRERAFDCVDAIRPIAPRTASASRGWRLAWLLSRNRR